MVRLLDQFGTHFQVKVSGLRWHDYLIQFAERLGLWLQVSERWSSDAQVRGSLHRDHSFLRILSDLFNWRLGDLAVLNTTNNRLLDIFIEPVWQIYILAGAKSHIRKINEHHYEFVSSDAMALGEIENLVNYFIKLIILASTKVS